MRFDPATEEWVERARRADVWDVLNLVAPHHALKLRGKTAVGPCPACGGTDRFSIDRRKNSFYCRAAAKGGDAIRMVEYLTGANFLGAVESITGEAPPRREQREESRKADPRLIEQRRLDAEAEADRRVREGLAYRDREIARAAAIWREGRPLSGSPAEAYLRLRGVQAPLGARLRCHPDLKYWHHSAKQGAFAVVHRGPALLARIDDADHHFMGCHCTYLDLATPKGKAQIIDPESGELLDAKKVRGSQKGGHIHLGGDPGTAQHLIIGEGIETTLSVREALIEAKRNLAAHLFWTAINLPNLGGPATQSVAHPTLTRADVKGRLRRVKVPGPVPDLAASPVLIPPAQLTAITLLGDGDSDRFTTGNVLARAAARWARPGRIIKAAWPGQGKDFNDLRMGCAA